jgi:hypothetical protein
MRNELRRGVEVVESGETVDGAASFARGQGCHGPLCRPPHTGEGRPPGHRPDPAAQPGHAADIRQNLFFAFVYNALGVPQAAGVLYPVYGLLLSPMVATTCRDGQLGLGDRQRAARRVALPISS